MLSVIMLSVVMLSVIMLSVVMLSVVAPFCTSHQWVTTEANYKTFFSVIYIPIGILIDPLLPML